MKKEVYTARLDNESLEKVSEEVRVFLLKGDLERQAANAAWFEFERALLAFKERFGADTEVTVLCGRMLGRQRFTVRVAGERFNPLEGPDFDDWEKTLAEFGERHPSHAYRGGVNSLSIDQEQLHLESFSQIILAIVLGVVVAALGNSFVPEEMRAMLYNDVLDPFIGVFTGMLSGLAGPLVFVSVAWGVCGIGNTAELGRSGTAIFSRFFSSIVLSTLVAIFACIPLFPSGALVEGGSSSLLHDLTKLVLGLIPTNVMAPFVEGNTAQIIVLAIVFGIAVLAFGEKSQRVRVAIHDLNAIVMLLMEQLCRFIPCFVFLVVLSQAWSGTLVELQQAWFPPVVAALLIFCILVIQFVIAGICCRVSPVLLVRKCIPITIIGLTTASSSACFGTMMSTCKEGLGIDKDQASFGVPLGIVLCKSCTAIEIAVLIMFCMHQYGVSADIAWYVHLGIVCLLYSMVIPPVPGGMIACLGLIVAEMGIPMQALGILTALDLIVDYAATAGDTTINVLNVLGAAYKLGDVDKTKLKAEVRQPSSSR